VKTCTTCGFDLWQYNQSTLTCKHGHRFDLDGKPVPAQPAYVAKPQQVVPYSSVVERRQPLALAALVAAVVSVVVDIVFRLVT
jgi:hypothetical protein